MTNTFKRWFFLACCYMAFIQATCNKKVDCLNAVYTFAVTAKVYPDMENINIGDTIWVELDEPNMFEDLQSGKTIDFSQAANLGLGIALDRFTGGDLLNPGTVAAAAAFSIHVREGTQLSSLQPERIRSFNFSEQAGRYRLKIAVVPSQAGTYSLGISDASNVFRKNDHCTKAGFKITLANTTQHLHLYEQNRPGYTPSAYEVVHMYCFKVN
jgi:hypothetical protein